MENLENPPLEQSERQSENINPPQAEMSFFAKLKTKWPVVLGIVGSLTLFTAIIYAAYSYSKHGQKIQPTPTVTPTPSQGPTVAVTPLLTVTLTPMVTPTLDPTADWNTYTNAKYGYSIRYPKSFQVVEVETLVPSPETGGYTTVKEKGDRVQIQNGRSWFAIHIDNGFQYPSIGSTCLGKNDISISEILIDGDILYEIDSLITRGFLLIASKYEEKNLGNQVLCPEIIWLHNNRRIKIAAEIAGVAQEDNQVVRQILSTFKFLD